MYVKLLRDNKGEKILLENEDLLTNGWKRNRQRRRPTVDRRPRSYLDSFLLHVHSTSNLQRRFREACRVLKKRDESYSNAGYSIRGSDASRMLLIIPHGLVAREGSDRLVVRSVSVRVYRGKQRKP